MSRRGNSYDVIESCFSTVKSEEDERFESYAPCEGSLVRLNRGVLKTAASSLHLWPDQPGRVRATNGPPAYLIPPPDRITPTRNPSGPTDAFSRSPVVGLPGLNIGPCFSTLLRKSWGDLCGSYTCSDELLGIFLRRSPPVPRQTICRRFPRGT